MLVPRLGERQAQALQTQLSRALTGFERTTCGSARIEDLARSELVIAPGDGSTPNLGTLTERPFAMIFYATLDDEIFGALTRLGLDAPSAWRGRFAFPAPPRSGDRDPAAESRSPEAQPG